MASIVSPTIVTRLRAGCSNRLYLQRWLDPVSPNVIRKHRKKVTPETLYFQSIPDSPPSSDDLRCDGKVLTCSRRPCVRLELRVGSFQGGVTRVWARKEQPARAAVKQVAWVGKGNQSLYVLEFSDGLGNGIAACRTRKAVLRSTDFYFQIFHREGPWSPL